MAFSTSKNGRSLSGLYASCKKCVGCVGMLFCLKTGAASRLGGFCGKVFSPTQEYYVGSDECCVFALAPQRQLFKSALRNVQYLRCDETGFTFGGGGDGPALKIDGNFDAGVTFRSDTFANVPLASADKDNRFRCVEFEVYVLK